ncbi:MAG: hypothetical protein ABSA39_15335 [Edaphobacter sp.]
MDEDDLELAYLLRETAGMTTEQLSDYLVRKQMFDPPLEGSLIAGRPICMVPDSDVKYGSFLEWWFAVGQKAPGVTAQGWGTVSGPYATKGQADVIPKDDWEKLPKSECEAIRSWANSIGTSMFYD